MPTERLRTEILNRSISAVWEQAVEEWKLIHIYMSDEQETCLCGHHPIREICVIRNARTDIEAEVGNCCVNNFLAIESERMFASVRRVLKDADASFNDITIAWAHESRIINLWERDFYLKIWRKTTLSTKRLAKKREINAKITTAIRR